MAPARLPALLGPVSSALRSLGLCDMLDDLMMPACLLASHSAVVEVISQLMAPLSASSPSSSPHAAVALDGDSPVMAAGGFFLGEQQMLQEKWSWLMPRLFFLETST